MRLTQTALKKLIQNFGRRLSVDIRPFEPSSSDAARLKAILKSHAVDLVLDVGANFGSYAQSLRNLGYRGKIVCFEPLSEPHQYLQELARKDPMLIVAPRLAIGAQAGETEINVSKNIMSSSLLPMLEAHLKACPDSFYTHCEGVRVARLDEVAQPYIASSRRVFLKADTQGFEAQVIEGARGILPRIPLLQLELSLVPLYEGETGFFDMAGRLQHMGYELFSLIPGFTDTDSGRMLALDAIFLRAGAEIDVAPG